ncbi:MAG: arginine--tRNA ligase [Thermoplasmata archaeon]
MEPQNVYYQQRIASKISYTAKSIISNPNLVKSFRNNEYVYTIPLFSYHLNEDKIKELSSLKIEEIKNTVYSNGYLNFIVEEKEFNYNVIKEVISLNKMYGAYPKNNKKVVIEHTSANPTGPIHIGRTRNSIIGDTLARIIKFAGYDVVTQYYVNDLGRQIAILTYGIEKENIHDIENLDHVVNVYIKYSTLDKENPSFSSMIDDRLNLIENDVETMKSLRAIVQGILNHILKSLEAINISFDEIVWESDYIINKKVDEVIELLKSNNLLKYENNAKYVSLTNEEKIFVTRTNGTSLYILRDLSYNIDKINKFDKSITILGEDHKAQYESIKAILKFILKKELNLYTIFYSFVTIMGKKMATRKGTSVLLSNLYEDAVKKAEEEIRKRRPEYDQNMVNNIAPILGAGAIRYNIIKIQPEKSISFNVDDAINFEGNSAPFIQYSYVRSNGILSKTTFETVFLEYSRLLFNPIEKQLIWKISEFPDVILNIVESYKPNLLASYVYSLAEIFNKFYDEMPVLNASEDMKKARLSLVKSTNIILKNGLELMGIDTPPYM